jgi:hypothetical protein
MTGKPGAAAPVSSASPARPPREIRSASLRDNLAAATAPEVERAVSIERRS